MAHLQEGEEEGVAKAIKRIQSIQKKKTLQRTKSMNYSHNEQRRLIGIRGEETDKYN